MYSIIVFIIFGLYFLPYATTPNYHYYLEGFLVSVLFSVSFLLPVYILEQRNKVRYIRYQVVNRKILNLVLLTLVTLVILGIIATLQRSNIVDFPPSSINDLIAVSAESAGRRYRGEISVSLFGKIGLISCYLLALILSLYVNKREVNYTIICVSWLLILGLSVVLGSKAILLYSLVLFISNYIVLLCHFNDKFKTSNYKNMITRLFFLFILIFAFFILMQSMRYSLVLSETVSILLPQFLSYSQGHVAGFHHFLMHDYKDFSLFSSLFGGSQTFYGVFELFQIPVTSNYVDAPKIIGPGTTTNVDTILRDLILDFGIMGSCVFLFSIASLFSFTSFNSICHRSLLGFRTVVLAVLLWSFTNSILTYSTIIVALFLNCIFLVFFLKSG